MTKKNKKPIKKPSKKLRKKIDNKKPSRKASRKNQIEQKTNENKSKEKQFIVSAPKTTKIKSNGIPLTKIEIKPQKKNTLIQDANRFIDSTMNALFKKSKDSNNMYQISYKLSNDRWYSSKFFKSASDDYYPNFTDSTGGSGGVNIDKETIVHINITIKQKRV